jgi:hypothetical protein
MALNTEPHDARSQRAAPAAPAAGGGPRPGEERGSVAIVPERVALVLALIIALLTASSVAGQLAKYLLGHDQVLGLVPLFYVAEEQNVPTWYSSVSLFACAALLALIGAAEGARGFRRHWYALALIFVYLSLDEAAQLHERLVEPTRALLGLHGALAQVAWLVWAMLFVLVLGLGLIRFLAHLPQRSRRAFVLAGVTFLVGAVGLELVGGWQSSRAGYENPTWAMLASAEELLEMTGIAIFLYALLAYLARQHGTIMLTFGRTRAAIPVGSTGRRPAPASM